MSDVLNDLTLAIIGSAASLPETHVRVQESAIFESRSGIMTIIYEFLRVWKFVTLTRSDDTLNARSFPGTKCVPNLARVKPIFFRE